MQQQKYGLQPHCYAQKKAKVTETLAFLIIVF